MASTEIKFEGNEFGLSYREFQETKGSRNWDSTVMLIEFIKFL